MAAQLASAGVFCAQMVAFIGETYVPCREKNMCVQTQHLIRTQLCLAILLVCSNVWLLFFGMHDGIIYGSFF